MHLLVTCLFDKIPVITGSLKDRGLIKNISAQCTSHSTNLYFKTSCHIRPHLQGSMRGLKIEGPCYVGIKAVAMQISDMDIFRKQFQR